MKIKANKKEQVLIDSLSIGTKNEVITNPYSGASCELEPTAVALFDFIKGSEALQLYDKMQMGLKIFRQNWADAYYKLLD